MSSSTLVPIFKDQLKHVTWTYSEPTKLSGSAYNVIARTTLSFEIPETGSGSVDMGFHLTCSTGQEEVTNVGFTIYSFEYSGY